MSQQSQRLPRTQRSTVPASQPAPVASSQSKPSTPALQKKSNTASPRSSIPSPGLRKPVLHTAAEELKIKLRLPQKPRTEDTDNSSELDITEDSLYSSPAEKNDVTTKETTPLTKCPCGLSDKTAVYLTCVSCQQEWHSNCCNLKGITQGAVKKLDDWECPRCYNCPHLPIDVQNDTRWTDASAYQSFMAAMSRIESCNNELKEHASSVEWFNQHIRHLLMDKSKFEANNQALFDIQSKLAADGPVNSDLKSQMTELKELTRELASNTPTVDVESEAERKASGQRIESLEMEIGKLTASVDSLVAKQSEKPEEEAGNQRIVNLEQQLQKLTAGIETLTSQQTAAPQQTATAVHGQVYPNTVSPKATKSTEPPCNAYKLYKESAVPVELKEELISFLASNKSDFAAASTEENSRQVMYFGKHRYKYKGADHESKEMPETIGKLLSLVQENLPEGCPRDLNSCLIHHYANGKSSIPLHRDDEPVIDPESPIVTVSLGAARTLTFHSNGNVKKEDRNLEDRSMLVCSRRSQDFWAHKLLSDEELVEERYSFTFRNIGPQFLNSTVILGDSNTRYVKFGSDFGTLGPNIPGKRIKVGHLEELPDAASIGPYRNIIIHTGINSISSKKYPRSNHYLVHHLEVKCKEYIAAYPKSRVHISMVLPTRIPMLNYRVREFNNFLLDMTHGVRNLSLIDNSMFGDTLDDSHGRYDSEKKQPMRTDVVHLGKTGIRLLASGFKTAVRGRTGPSGRTVGPSESQKRFRGGGGNFAAAANRTSSPRDGYQGPD